MNRSFVVIVLVLVVTSSPLVVRADDRRPKSDDVIEILTQERIRVLAAEAKRQPLLQAADEALYGGKPARAILEYARALVVPVELSPRSPNEYRNNDGRLHAAQGLARAHAEQGKFQQALMWLRKTNDFPAEWCGVATYPDWLRDVTRKRVWTLAGGSRGEADLRSLVSMKARIFPNEDDPEREAYAREVAAREARLLLAELRCRQGKSAEARLLLLPIAEKHPDRGPLDADNAAWALLQRLQGQQQ